MVAAAGPPPRGVGGDAVDNLPLPPVVFVAVLLAERSFGSPPELHLRGQRREEGHEHDIGFPPVRDDPHGGRRCRVEGGEEPVLGAVLLDEGALGVGRVVVRGRVVRVGGGRDAGVGGGEGPVPVEEAVVERAGEVGDVDPEAAVGFEGLKRAEDRRGSRTEEEEGEGEEQEEDGAGEDGEPLHGRRRRPDLGGRRRRHPRPHRHFTPC